MIFLETARQQLSSLERFGLSVLVDLSRLIPVLSPSERVVTLMIDDSAPDGESLHLTGSPGRVHVSRASLRRAGATAAAKVEQDSREADRHGRVPSQVNPLVAMGQYTTPFINDWARLLREAVVQWAGDRPVQLVSPWPQGHRWAAALTHDLDVVALWPLFTGLRLFELGRKAEVRQAARVARSAARSLTRNPVAPGVASILDIERELGVRSTWFVLAGTPSVRSVLQGDVTYSVESAQARRILALIGDDGHEIGLHGSFATMLDAGAMVQERERLEAVTGGPISGVRQHFLRMRPGATQRAMVTAGFAYDATYGFPDRNGFRLGSADVIPAWNARDKTTDALEEVPLVWMDRAQSKYSGIENPVLWVAEGLELARACQKVEGFWVGLWHPNLVPALGFPDAVEEYRRLVQVIIQERPYIAPLHTIVNWRKARRSVHALGVSADGAVTFRAGTPSVWPLIIEDSRGTVVSQLPWPQAA